MKVLYDKVYKGKFIERCNRFVVKISFNGEDILAHLPNPGRMWELLFPEVSVYIVPHGREGLKTAYRIVGIEREGIPIMLDTNYSNEVAYYLIQTKAIPGWEEWQVKRREYTVGSSRFDLLLENERGETFLLEVKSCTLFSKKGAMFPDAITERGRRHLLHLAELHKQGYRTGVLFLVQWEKAEWFLPDYHTDLAFAEAFLAVSGVLDWKAVALRWSASFAMPEVVRLCSFSHRVLEKEGKDSGDYVMVMKLDKDKNIEIASRGYVHFDAGYYLYVGAAKKNLQKRIDRHKRKKKKYHWHIDYLREHCEVIAVLPIRSSNDLECKIAEKIEKIADWKIEGFGSSDCSCKSHLFGMANNPVHTKAFMAAIEDFRMNRLNKKIISSKRLVDA